MIKTKDFFMAGPADLSASFIGGHAPTFSDNRPAIFAGLADQQEFSRQAHLAARQRTGIDQGTAWILTREAMVPGGGIGSVGMYQLAALIEAVPRISLTRCTVKMHQRPTL